MPLFGNPSRTRLCTVRLPSVVAEEEWLGMRQEWPRQTNEKPTWITRSAFLMGAGAYSIAIQRMLAPLLVRRIVLSSRGRQTGITRS